MTAILQLDLFEPNDEVSLLQKRLNEMKKSLDARSRKQFHMLNDMGKELIGLKEEVYQLRTSMIKREK